MRVVILVPRREGFPDRDALWAFCRPRWSTYFPDWPIVEGHHETGLFNRAAAVNTAAQLAGDWDVTVIIDSDMLIGPELVRDAVALAHESGNLVVPFEARRSLSLHGTRKVIAGFAGNWQSFVARTFTDQHSGVIVVPRRLWDAVGGFDEGFCGWGLEDTAFAVDCELHAGKLHRTWGAEAWHLHHATAKGEKHGSPSHRANMARAERHRAALALGDKAMARALVEEGRELAASRVTSSIPAIIHRVVPEQTPQVAEDWWAEFGKLHPGWRLMTHRDPLDPAEWPLTSPHWGKVKVGAQLADLVRLEALLRWGGFYVDADVQPFRSLAPLASAEVVAAWEDERVVPNAVLGARPDHPAIRECLELAIARMVRGVWAAGPGVTTEVLTRRDDVLLLPPGSFYAVSYQDPQRDLRMQSKPAPWEYVRHHYWGSWLPEERRRVPAA